MSDLLTEEDSLSGSQLSSQEWISKYFQHPSYITSTEAGLKLNESTYIICSIWELAPKAFFPVVKLVVFLLNLLIIY